MREVPIDELRALGVDLASCTEADVVALAQHSRRVRGFLDSVDAGLSRRLKELKAAGKSSGATPREVLGGASGETSGERDRRERRADALGEASGFDEALSEGAIVASHVDVFARHLADLAGDIRAAFLAHQTELLAHARDEDAHRFGRRCRDLIARLERDAGIARAQRQRANTRLDRRIDLSTGMYHLSGCFDPEAGSRIFAHLDTEIVALAAGNHEEHQAMNRLQLAAAALLNLTTRGNDAGSDDWDDDHDHDGDGGSGGHGRGGNRPANVEMCVHVDWRTVIEGPHTDTVCETETGVPIPLATARRLACNAKILPIVLGGDGIPLDHGRGRRQASRAQRRALRAMYHGCAFPGCERRFDQCEMHHLLEWEHLGNTDIANLLPLCSYHHHRVHEDGWGLHLAPDRTLTVTRTDGVIHAVVSLPSAHRNTTTAAPTANPESTEPTRPTESRRSATARPTPDCDRPPGRRRCTSNQTVEQLRLA